MGQGLDEPETSIMNDREGCRLFGAYRVVSSIQDAGVLIHSTAGCSWGTLAFHNPACPGEIRQGSTTLHERDLLTGGLPALENALTQMHTIQDTSCVFVLTGCVPEIIGDVIEPVIKNHSTKERPIIGIRTPGFGGDAHKGRDDALRMLVSLMTQPERPQQDEKIKSINIIGPLADDFRISGDIDGMRSLLGNEIRINAVIPFDTFAHICNAPAADMNVVFPSFEAAGIAMKERFGIPWISVNYPYGYTGSRTFLMEIHNALRTFGHSNFAAGNSDKGFSKSHECIQQSYEKEIEPLYAYLQKLYAMPVAIAGDAARGPALKRFLEREMGMLVQAFDDGSDPDGFERSFLASNAVLLFGSSFERGVAEIKQVPLIRFRYPVFDAVSLSPDGFTGTQGTIRLIEAILNALMSVSWRTNGAFG